MSALKLVLGEGDVRRFVIPEAVPSRLAFIEDLVRHNLDQSRLPVPAQSPVFFLKWRDDEDELITLSTDEEIADALVASDGKVLKLFVHVNQGPDELMEVTSELDVRGLAPECGFVTASVI